MSLVPNGSIVTYVATFSPGVGYNSNDVKAALISALLPLGFNVITSTISGENLLSIGTEELTVTMQIEVKSGYDYGSESDVASIINHAIYDKFGVLPAASIPRFQPPSGGSVRTGQPVPPDPGKTGPQAGGCIAGSSNDLSGKFSLSCWFDNLTTKGLSTVGLLTMIIAIGIGIFIFAPRPRVSVG